LSTKGGPVTVCACEESAERVPQMNAPKTKRSDKRARKHVVQLKTKRMNRQNWR
jgi:hypothetical protein